jgi:hypothetical protein
LRDRCGHVLPDDDAGREYLWLLLQNVSLAPAGADKKMRHVIELWAPWLPEAEANERIEFLKLLIIPERTPTARDLGERLRVTNAERERLGLWPFKPIDATDEQLAEQAKLKERKRRARKRRSNGVRTRAAYLAELRAKPKPWVTQGLSRAAYYRKRKRDGVCPHLRRGESEIIVLKHRTHLVSVNVVSPKEGNHGSAMPENPKQIATQAERVETNAPSSPEHRTDLVSPESDDPRLAALKNWGLAAKQITPEQKKRFQKIRARFDALADPSMGAAA